MSPRTTLNVSEYHLVVIVWIMNSKGKFLISRRAPEVIWMPGMWDTIRGSAIFGDDSLTTALKETSEEIGVALIPEKWAHFRAIFTTRYEDEGGNHYDVWLFYQDIDFEDVILQPTEVCDAMWANQTEIRNMIAAGIFVSEPYLADLFTSTSSAF